MNATFGEVLREVLTGLLIMDQTLRGVGSEEDAPERRRFQDRVDLHLGAMHSLSTRERKKHHHTEYKKIEK